MSARVCVCVYVCVCVRARVHACLSVASHISDTSEAIAVTFDTVAASVMRLHRVLIILTLTFIQGHTDSNHENNKCDYFRKCSSSNPHQVCCEDRPTKGLHDQCQSDDLDLQGHKCVSNWSTFYLQYLGQYVSYFIQTWHDGRLTDTIIQIMLMLVSMTLTLVQGHSVSAKAKQRETCYNGRPFFWFT